MSLSRDLALGQAETQQTASTHAYEQIPGYLPQDRQGDAMGPAPHSRLSQGLIPHDASTVHRRAR